MGRGPHKHRLGNTLASDLPQKKGLGPVKKVERKKIYYYLLYNNVNINTKTGKDSNSTLGYDARRGKTFWRPKEGIGEGPLEAA